MAKFVSSRYYYTKTKYGYSGHQFLPTPSIQKLMDALPFCEHHVSMQGYLNGQVIFTNLMFDIDCEDSLEEALSVTRAIEFRLDRNGIEYDTYFSGSKGFHVMTKCLIFGEDSHLVCGAIQKKFFSFDYVDNQIYRNKGTIRAIGSRHLKTGLFKTKIDTRWSIKKIKEESATLKYAVANFRYNYTRATVFADEIFIPPRVEHDDVEYEYSESPCVTKMINDKNPPRDLWHKIIYTIAKHCLGKGMKIEDAIAEFDRGFFGTNTASGYTRASYVKVVRSVYRSGIHQLGCKTGLCADAMKNYCSMTCIFNKYADFSKFKM